MQNFPNETADHTKTRTAGNVIAGTSICETEAVDHRRSRYPDQDSNALDRTDDCAAVAAFIATSFCDQWVWGNTDQSFVDEWKHLNGMMNPADIDIQRGHCVTVVEKLKTKWAILDEPKPKQLARASKGIG